MYRPMPSPNGSNFEQLFIRSGPVAAYDARGGLDGLSPSQYGRRAASRLTGRLAYDDENFRQEQSDQGDAETEAAIGKMVDWCKSNLSRDDLTTLMAALTELQGEGGAQDEPPDFPGRPRTGGTMSPMKAMDSRRRGREMATADRLSLDAICPGLARIKCL